jgi:hypothetical protein
MKVTQKQMAFLTLLYQYAKNSSIYIATWEFVGEFRNPTTGEWLLRSYKCPTRLTDIYQENPDLLDRKWITGKSGSRYYGYRIKKPLDPNNVRDPKLRDIVKQTEGTRLYSS